MFMRENTVFRKSIRTKTKWKGEGGGLFPTHRALGVMEPAGRRAGKQQPAAVAGFQDPIGTFLVNAPNTVFS